ncbi:MucBP domain-containing protein, partial [Enterococcus gilvus]|uniref:MucBP domain-containing protein n=1 Tax=Enterococcus gilvus TaxID=160453 RepID=UPI003D6BA37F
IGDTAGTFSQTEQKIVYHYKKNVIPETGKVTVSYVDESGVDLTTPLTLTGDVGSEYSTEKKTFDGYEFVEVTGDTAGTFSQTEQKIVYHYKKNVIPETGKVTVSYVDESGVDLTTPLTLTGDVGSEYSTEKKAFDGYEFVEVTGDTAGTFSQTEQKIVYRYQAAAGNILFNLKVNSFSGESSLSVSDYIMKGRPSISSVDSLKFVELDSDFNVAGPVSGLDAPAISNLLNGQSLNFTGKIGSSFMDTSDPNKDSITALLNYDSYIDGNPLGIEFSYTDSNGNKNTDILIVFSSETSPGNLDDLKFSNGQQEASVIWTVGFIG